MVQLSTNDIIDLGHSMRLFNESLDWSFALLGKVGWWVLASPSLIIKLLIKERVQIGLYTGLQVVEDSGCVHVLDS